MAWYRCLACRNPRLILLCNIGSLKITLTAFIFWLGFGGKKATGVKPAGTKARANACGLPAAAPPGDKSDPPPTKIEDFSNFNLSKFGVIFV